MTIFPRPSEWIRSATGGVERQSRVHREQHYFAFLSYSHRDEATARWLHEELEKFRVPSAFVGKVTDHGPVPRRLTPVFRDLKELPASSDLGTEIREAIAGSRFLIVLCSPSSAASHWTNAEIEAFKKVRPESCVLAAILAGEPFASEIPGQEQDECLPPALRYHYDSRGRRTRKRVEPLAADLSTDGEARRLGFLKLVAGMLGLGLDDLVQRETMRRHRRLALVTAASLTGMVVASGLAITAIQARNEAHDQRSEAEGLVGFMLGDLRDKLDPIGRLDVLDAVGARALEYYAGQDESGLTDEALAQRSRALTLMGEIATARGDLDAGLARYQEAMTGTAEMVRRKPDDPQRLFDHAQNVFWVGDIALQRGRLGPAEAAMREYKRLADRMVALEPDNRKWRMETQYADNNLGALLHKQRRYAEAAGQLERAVATSESLAAGDPNNQEFQLSLAESLAWLADAQFGAGRLDEAIAMRERQVALLTTLADRYPNHADYRQRAVPARRALGRWLASRGALEPGLEQVSAAVRIGQQLIPVDPENMQWQEYTAGAQLDLAKILLIAGKHDDAVAQTMAGCELIERLARRDRTIANWRSLEVECLGQRARVASQGGAHREALALAKLALARAKSDQRGDPVDARVAIITAYKLVGDVYDRSGDRRAALPFWNSGLSLWPKQLSATPREMSMRAEMLSGSGRAAEARPILERLRTAGYRWAI